MLYGVFNVLEVFIFGEGPGGSFSFRRCSAFMVAL